MTSATPPFVRGPCVVRACTPARSGQSRPGRSCTGSGARRQHRLAPPGTATPDTLSRTRRPRRINFLIVLPRRCQQCTVPCSPRSSWPGAAWRSSLAYRRTGRLLTPETPEEVESSPEEPCRAWQAGPAGRIGRGVRFGAAVRRSVKQSDLTPAPLSAAAHARPARPDRAETCVCTARNPPCPHTFSARLRNIRFRKPLGLHRIRSRFLFFFLFRVENSLGCRARLSQRRRDVCRRMHQTRAAGLDLC